MFMLIGILIILAIAFSGSFIYYFFKYLYLLIVKKESINIGNTDINDNVDDDNVDQTIDDEIAMLEIAISRRQQVAIELENELNNTYGKSKQQILLKLNTLDKQTFKDKQRIAKLKNQL